MPVRALYTLHCAVRVGTTTSPNAKLSKVFNSFYFKLGFFGKTGSYAPTAMTAGGGWLLSISISRRCTLSSCVVKIAVSPGMGRWLIC